MTSPFLSYHKEWIKGYIFTYFITAFFEFLVVQVPRSYKVTQFSRSWAYNLGKAKSFRNSQSVLPWTITLLLNLSEGFYELSNVPTLWTTHKAGSVPSCKSVLLWPSSQPSPHFQSLQLQLCSHFCSLWSHIQKCIIKVTSWTAIYFQEDLGLFSIQ